VAMSEKGATIHLLHMCQEVDKVLDNMVRFPLLFLTAAAQSRPNIAHGYLIISNVMRNIVSLFT
jgi:hypothetical protein